MQTEAGGRAILRFCSGQGGVSMALSDVTAFLAREGLPQSLVEDANIALAEALNNIEEHAYRGQRGFPVTLNLVAGERCVKCEIEDRGTPLPGGSLPAGSMPASDPVAHEKWPEGGFGWALLRRLTSDLSYERKDGVNSLCFTIS